MTVTDQLSFGEADGTTWSVFLAGDCVLNPGERSEADPVLSPALRRCVAGADLALVNLEAPLAGDDAEPIPKSGPALTTATGTPAWLADAGFDVATMANNHAMDYGWGQLRATLDDCADSGLDAVGAGPDRETAMTPTYQAIDDQTVAVVSVCEREFGVATADDPGTAWSGHPDAVDAVASAAERADVVVLAAHGGVEYVPLPPPQRRQRLARFVDAGADVVVGHHPHVAQGWEQIRDGFVLHSLGNFLFDAHADGDATGWGLAVELEFSGATLVGVTLVPTEVIDGVVHELGSNRETAAHLDYLHRLAEITSGHLRPHWQSLAVRKFYETYSTWLIDGLGADETAIANARANPHDPRFHEPLWSGSRSDRLDGMLVLLNVVRNESHRAVVTDALAVLTGACPDRRTADVERTVDELQEWTRR